MGIHKIMLCFIALSLSQRVDAKSYIGNITFSPPMLDVSSASGGVVNVSAKFHIDSQDSVQTLIIGTDASSVGETSHNRFVCILPEHFKKGVFVSEATGEPSLISNSDCAGLTRSKGNVNGFESSTYTMWVEVKYTKLTSPTKWIARSIDVAVSPVAEITLGEFPVALQLQQIPSTAGECPTFQAVATVKTVPSVNMEVVCDWATVSGMSSTYKDMINTDASAVTVSSPLRQLQCSATATPKGGLPTSVAQHAKASLDIEYDQTSKCEVVLPSTTALEPCFQCDCIYKWSVDGRPLPGLTNRSAIPIVTNSSNNELFVAEVCAGQLCVNTSFCTGEGAPTPTPTAGPSSNPPSPIGEIVGVVLGVLYCLVKFELLVLYFCYRDRVLGWKRALTRKEFITASILAVVGGVSFYYWCNQRMFRKMSISRHGISSGTTQALSIHQVQDQGRPLPLLPPNATENQSAEKSNSPALLPQADVINGVPHNGSVDATLPQPHIDEDEIKRRNAEILKEIEESKKNVKSGHSTKTDEQKLPDSSVVYTAIDFSKKEPKGSGLRLVIPDNKLSWYEDDEESRSPTPPPVPPKNDLLLADIAEMERQREQEKNEKEKQLAVGGVDKPGAEGDASA